MMRKLLLQILAVSCASVVFWSFVLPAVAGDSEYKAIDRVSSKEAVTRVYPKAPPWLDPTPPGCPSPLDPFHLFDNECLYNPFADIPAPAGHTLATTSNWIASGHYYSWSALGHVTATSRTWSRAGHTASLTGLWIRHGHALTPTKAWTSVGHSLTYSLAGHATSTSSAWINAGHELEPTMYWTLIGHVTTPSFAWNALGHDITMTQQWQELGHSTELTIDWNQNGHNLTATRETGHCENRGPDGLPIC